MRNFFLYFFLGLFYTSLCAQDLNYQAFLLNAALTENANAIVRDEVVEVHVESIERMRIFTRRVVTVLNDKGDKYAYTYDSYDKNTKIKDQKAYVYDKTGKQINKYKKKDFSDQSLVGSNDLYNDNRVSYLDYTARDYPYTIVYESEVQTSYTIFVRDWKPVLGYNLSIEKASYILKNPASIPVRFKENNLAGLEIEKNNNGNELHYTLKNFPVRHIQKCL